MKKKEVEIKLDWIFLLIYERSKVLLNESKYNYTLLFTSSSFFP